MTEQEIEQARADLAQLDIEQLRCGVMLQLLKIEELTNERDRLQYEVDAIPAIKAERDALAAAAKLALEALTHYANTYNWDEDFHGIRRKWLEPETSTPRAYNGFELAQKTLAALKKAGVQ